VLTVYARSTAAGTFNQARTVSVTVAPSEPRAALNPPGEGWELAQPFVAAGWATDLGAGSGTGVDRVRLLAYPNPGSGQPPIGLGEATYGMARPDVAQYLGNPQFTNSGFQREIRGLTPGVFRLVAMARSTVSGTEFPIPGATITVHANPRMWVDLPAPNSAVNQTVTLSGWAIDLATASGTGVSTLHVWAYPSSGSPIFLGVPTYGGARSDVGAAYGAQFTNSGFNLIPTTTLAPGAYTVVVSAWSTVTNSFNQAQSVPITVATSQPLLSIDTPAPNATVAQPFHLGGWAIDRGAPSGTGIDAVDIHAIANGGSGAWTFLGRATYGAARTDVGAAYGSQFTNSGWGLTASGLAPGAYQINVYEHSTVSGQWTVQSRWITVQ
jgi:hypothetical protein